MYSRFSAFWIPDIYKISVRYLLPPLLQLISTYSLPSLQSISTYPPLTLQLTSISHLNNDSNSIEKVVSDLKEFLKELDSTYEERKYIQYLEIFENNDIRVNLIPKISNEW
ncbi:hypothetical protein C1645_830317 [Glomus cerebriforme]|uniref:Uncharacterized protein n=1 Tax=Glomus cerebriforme TaxID=658196 RepID=A0A397SMC0_9GLOM|nr:hypothetical protein C1645_830317 [Glomus cerebriforme]